MNKDIIKVDKEVVWTRIPAHNNMILQNNSIRVSYNPIAGADKSDELGMMAQMIGGLMNGKGEPQEETALYDIKNDKWYILKGDFRKDYEKAFPKWKACKAVYDKYKDEHRSEWSTDDF